MVQACARVWSEDPSTTPLLKRCLRAVFTALVEHDQTLIEGIELVMLPTNERDADIRDLLTQTENPYVRRVWAQFARLRDDRFEEVFSSTNNRLADFLTSERMSRIFGFGRGSLDLQRCMDESHCIFLNLQPLQISADNARLLGTLIANELLLLARSRSNDLARRHPFYVYVDEAHQFLTDDIEQAIDLTRQKGLHYILAHQRLSQLQAAGENIYRGVMSIRNKLVFGDVDADDTGVLARELHQGAYDEDQEVAALRRPVVVAHEIRKNKQYRTTKNRSVARGQAETRVAGVSEGNNAAFSLPTDAIGTLSGELIDGTSSSVALTAARGEARSEVTNVGDGLTEGWAESAWPILEERPGALRSFDEQMHIFAKEIRALPERTALLKLRGKMPLAVNIPYVGDPVTRPDRLKQFFASASELSDYSTSVAAAENARKVRQTKLSRAANVCLDDEPESPSAYFE